MTDKNTQQTLAMNVEGAQLASVDKYQFEPIQGYARLHWEGKRPFRSTQYYPAQLKETYGEPVDGWMNRIFWGDNLQVMSHLLKEFRGKINFIYIDPPFDSKADYKKQIAIKGKNASNDMSAFEEKQYTDIWTNDEYLQFMYERLVLMRELLSDDGCIYLHCDYRKIHQLRCLMDEIFGEGNFLNSLVWMFSTRSSIKSSWKRSHHDILLYKKSSQPVFNWNDEMVMESLSENTIKKYRLEDEIGRYRLCGRFIKDSPIKGAKDVDSIWEQTHPELVVRDYLRAGKVPNDHFFIDIENQSSNTRTDYPTQKPEELLYKLISASSKPGDIVFDCFMGSGTAQAVAMKLGRKFIGADINLGSIQTTTKRLIAINNEMKDIPDNEPAQVVQNVLNSFQNEEDLNDNLGFIQDISQLYRGFSVYNVNHYEIFRNPVEAKEILLDALEIQPITNDSIFDGQKDLYLVKIMPINRIATKADLSQLVTNFDYKLFDKRKENNPNQPVERIMLVCMGHEPGLGAALEADTGYKMDVKVVDILRDKSKIEFKRDSDANIVILNNKLIVEQFYPMNLLQKLSLYQEDVNDWRQLVETIMIDWNYDGDVLRPTIIDAPGKNELVSGEYNLPAQTSRIRIKITDLLSESLEVDVQNG